MNTSSIETISLGMTAGKYFIAEKMARNIKVEKLISVLMAAFVATNLLDGIIVRKLNATLIGMGIAHLKDFGKIHDRKYKVQ